MYRTRIGDHELTFETAPTLFSPHGLDLGTATLLAHAVVKSGDKVLDLGCGYGPVGVHAAMITDLALVWLVDIDPVAVEHARSNLRRNGIEGATVVLSDAFSEFSETGFTKILCNPPYHADFSVPRRLIEKGFNRLAIGGSLWMVTKREAWYRNKLSGVFGGVRVIAEGGYFVFEATKRSSRYANGRRER